MKCQWIAVLFMLLSRFSYVISFARNLIIDYCDRQLEVGIVMMGKEVQETFEKNITVFRNNIQLNSGDSYNSGDELIVYLEPKSFQMVLEVKGNAHFSKGACKNKVRTIDSGGAILVVNNDEKKDAIEIKGAFAFTYSTGVKVTKPFILYFNEKVVEL